MPTLTTPEPSAHPQVGFALNSLYSRLRLTSPLEGKGKGREEDHLPRQENNGIYSHLTETPPDGLARQIITHGFGCYLYG